MGRVLGRSAAWSTKPSWRTRRRKHCLRMWPVINQGTRTCVCSALKGSVGLLQRSCRYAEASYSCTWKPTAVHYSAWVHSSVVRAADCRSAGPWFKSGCALSCTLRSPRLLRQHFRRTRLAKQAWHHSHKLRNKKRDRTRSVSADTLMILSSILCPYRLVE